MSIEAETMTSPARSLSQNRAVFALVSLVAVVLLSFVYFHLFGDYPRDSDQANWFRMAQDVAGGNWVLRGWSISADTFWTTETLFEAVPAAIFGPDPKIMIAVPAVMWALIVVASAWACVANPRWSPAGLLLIATILGAPILRGNDPMQMIGRAPMHIGPTLYMLLMFYLAARVMDGRGTLLAALACCLLTAVSVAGDPLVIVLGALPIAAVAAFELLDRIERRSVLTAGAALGGIVLGRAAVAVIKKAGGLSPYSTPANFVSFQDLGGHIWRGLYSALLLTGTNFFGRPVKAAIPFLARLPLLGTMIWATGLVGYHYLRRVLGHHVAHRFSPFDRILAVSVLINIPAGILSDLLTGDWEARYFLPALVFGAILAARMVPSIRWLNWASGAALALTLIFAAVSYAKYPTHLQALDPQVVQLADRLAAEHLDHGYGSYWSSSVTTIASRGRIGVGAVDVDGSGHIVPRHWNSRDDWYDGFGRTRPFFALADRRNIESSLPKAPIVATFGPPSRTFDIPGFQVLVYE